MTDRIRVGGNVMRAQLVCQYAPVYPETAKADHVEGKVLLHAIIDKDGCIKDLRIISGDDMLAKSAVQPVRLWRYRPTLLLNHPIEVDTTVVVIFTLH